jgi:hypothetical protein
MSKRKGVPKAIVPCSMCGKDIELGAYVEHVQAEHTPLPASGPTAQTQAPQSAPPQAPQQAGQYGNIQGNVSVPPPEQPKFLNMTRLGELGWRHEGIVKAVKQGGGNFGPGFNLMLDSGFTVTVKQNSQNHFDLYEAFGPNWVGRKVLVQPGTTPRGSARIAVGPAQ